MSALGTIEFRVIGLPVSATLDDGKTWDVRCGNATVQETVKLVLDEIAGREYGPADGFYGPAVLETARKGFRGKIVDRVEPESVPGTVY